jgi:hypothetical protein
MNRCKQEALLDAKSSDVLKLHCYNPKSYAEYCELVEEIGKASLGASDKEIWHLTKVYWCA